MLNARAASVSPTNFTRQKEIEQKDNAAVPLRQAGDYNVHCASPSGVSSRSPALILANVLGSKVWQEGIASIPCNMPCCHFTLVSPHKGSWE